MFVDDVEELSAKTLNQHTNTHAVHDRPTPKDVDEHTFRSFVACRQTVYILKGSESSRFSCRHLLLKLN